MSSDPTDPTEIAALAEVEAIGALWSRVEAALDAAEPGLSATLGPPASEATLEALRRLGLPSEWIALYARHDGQTADLDPLFGEWRFLPVGELDPSLAPEPSPSAGSGRSAQASMSSFSAEPTLASEHRRMIELSAGLASATQPEPPVGPMKRAWGTPAWVPFAIDEVGGSLCLDLAPEAGGRVGQVLDLDHEGPRRVRWASLAELLTTVAVALENGHRRLRRWRPLPGGRRVRDGWVELRLAGVGALRPGQTLPLGPAAPGLCLVAVHGPTVQPGGRRGEDMLWLGVDLLDPSARPASPWQLLDLRVEGPGDHWIRRVGGFYGIGGEAIRAPAAAINVHVDLLADGQAPSEDAGVELRQGRPRSARAGLGEAADLSGAPLRQRARARALVGDHAAALADLDRAIALRPSPDLWVERAVQRRANGALRAALDDLAAALRELPEGWLARELRVRILVELGRGAEALDEAELAVRGADSAGLGRALLMRAELRSTLGDVEGAVTDIDAALAARLDDEERIVARAAAHRIREQRLRARSGGSVGGVLRDVGLLLGRSGEAIETPEGTVVPLRLSVAEAAVGGVAELRVGEGRFALRLPPGAGAGSRLSAHGLLPEGAKLWVEVEIVLPEGDLGDGVRGAIVAVERWDLRVQLPLSADELRRGGSFLVPGVDGPELIHLGAGLRLGSLHRRAERGLTRGPNARGELVVELIAAT